MSQFRNVSVDTRTVVYGVNNRPVEVLPDGVVTVEDGADENYVHQFEIWAPADAGAEAALGAWRAAHPDPVAAVAAPEPEEHDEPEEGQQ